MSRKQLQARYDQDTAEQLEQFAEDKGISRSEALRRAARDKLRAEGYREVAVPSDDNEVERRSVALRTIDAEGHGRLYAARQSSTILSIIVVAIAAVVLAWAISGGI